MNLVEIIEMYHLGSIGLAKKEMKLNNFNLFE